MSLVVLNGYRVSLKQLSYVRDIEIMLNILLFKKFICHIKVYLDFQIWNQYVYHIQYLFVFIFHFIFLLEFWNLDLKDSLELPWLRLINQNTSKIQETSWLCLSIQETQFPIDFICLSNGNQWWSVFQYSRVACFQWNMCSQYYWWL